MQIDFYWNAPCISNRMMRQNLSPAVERISRPDWATPGRSGRALSPWSVHVEIIIKAEVRRLFHALTAPEYIETWISFPGHMAGCTNIASRVADDFAIQHLCHGITTTHISGTYSICERHNLALSWRVDGERTVAASSLDIRLSGYFESTMLHLRHCGLASKEDYVWHQSLWSASLARLKGLYGSTPLRPDKQWEHLSHHGTESAKKRKEARIYKIRH